MTYDFELVGKIGSMALIRREEADVDYCDVSLDEDEMERYLGGSNRDCPYFKLYDEYKMVEKQN